MGFLFLIIIFNLTTITTSKAEIGPFVCNVSCEEIDVKWNSTETNKCFKNVVEYSSASREGAFGSCTYQIKTTYNYQGSVCVATSEQVACRGAGGNGEKEITIKSAYRNCERSWETNLGQNPQGGQIHLSHTGKVVEFLGCNRR